METRREPNFGECTEFWSTANSDNGIIDRLDLMRDNISYSVVNLDSTFQAPLPEDSVVAKSLQFTVYIFPSRRAY